MNENNSERNEEIKVKENNFDSEKNTKDNESDNEAMDSEKVAEQDSENLQETLSQKESQSEVASQQKTNDSLTNNIELILDINMDMTVEIGRTKMKIDEVLNLGKGSIVELNHLNGENIDIMVNNKLIAKGELVSIDDNFGVRIINIIEKSERLNLYNNY